MKKNRMMRLASLLLVAVLMTTCTISGTFAKYTTSATGADSARVANWGFESNGELTLSNLFLADYTDVNGTGGDNVIAPGTKGEATFYFVYDETNAAAPEVDYTFTVNVVDTCDPLIKANKNIIWKLDGVAQANWDALVTAIKGLSGDNTDGIKEYTAGNLPAGFADQHTISWEWIFEDPNAGGSGAYMYDHDNNAGTPELTQDQYDTYMGNAASLDDVSLEITITVTQVNPNP